ncbi:hypothetical protein J0A68_06485 [Algoriphagus sp. H41]|uniref:Aerotolerance regulator N-terminal domain-containing protein n=1 Tax=Algoriphagus oliviformis TaxID=2811231 RepID=A0ABS3C0E5_9BACT|nr:hypothetical protein [Algoriphagus oliviformis]MBN7810592.1 hypothetical protein [Algoriphagus oliviformis]
MNFHYQPLVSWPFFFGFVAILVLVGGLTLFFQWRNKTASKRLLIRGLLLLGFVFCLAMLLLRPQREVEPGERQVIVYQDDLDKKQVDFWRDSLEVNRAVALSRFQPRSEMVFLLGEKFDAQQLYGLRNLDFEWILPHENAAVRDLAWKGFVRKGEKQRLAYEVYSESDSSMLAISGSNLEPKPLTKGWNSGLLEFSPSGLGRAEFPLLLDEDTLANVRFYIGAASPKKYHFQLGFPSAESRTLGNWLREKGEKVTEEIQLSRETVLYSGLAGDSLQVLIVDPAQLEQKSVQNLVKEGKAALVVMNVSQAVETAQTLNRLFGTDFQVSRISQEETRTLESGAETLPFSFLEKSGQKLRQDGSLAVQLAGSVPVSMSLITASYPFSLQGKSEEYEAVWGELFGLLEPDEKSAWRMEAPLLTGVSKDLERLSQDSLPDQLIWAKDTIYLRRSAANPFLAEGKLQITDSSWVDLDSGFSAFVYGEDELAALRTRALISDLKSNSPSLGGESSSFRLPFSPWIWIVGMLLTLGLLWLEPKLQL